MMTVYQLPGCCGVREITNLSNTSKREFKASLLNRFLEGDGWHGAAFYLFTQAGEGRKYGEEFADYLAKYRLGRVVSTSIRVNPNSGNKLKAWMWAPSQEGLSDHLKMKGNR